MKVRAVSGNPYKDSLLRGAFGLGRRDRLKYGYRVKPPCISARTDFAYEAGFKGRGWHRSPNGQVKWQKEVR